MEMIPKYLFLQIFQRLSYFSNQIIISVLKSKLLCQMRSGIKIKFNLAWRMALLDIILPTPTDLKNIFIYLSFNKCHLYTEQSLE